MPKNSLAIFLLGSALGLPGCVVIKVPDLSYVKASDVINSLKDELAEVEKYPINEKVRVDSGSCGAVEPDGRYVNVVIGFKGADVTLKTVATDTLTGTVTGAKIPLGSVLVGGSGSLTRTSIRTQQVTYSLGNVDEAGKEKAQASVANRIFKPLDAGAQFIQIYSVDGKKHRVAKTEALPTELHPIATAIVAARDQILAIDHAREPCLTPTNVKVEVDFQIQKKYTVKGDIGFLVFLDIAGESDTQREAANSIAVTFTLKGSSASVY